MNHVLPTSTTTDERDKHAQVAILPIGSFEQHGPYLPLITDTVIATSICHELAVAYPLFELPPVTVSCSHEHSTWPGTVSISPRTLYSVVTDIADWVTRSGLSALVLVNAHGGNYVLSNVVQEANAHGTRMALFPAGPDWNNARVAAGLREHGARGHARREIETSILLHTHPELVKDGFESGDCVADDRRDLLVEGMTGYTTSGVIGRPSLSSAEKGKAVMAALVQSFADLLHVLS